jgi:hypothetical protein
VAIVALVKRQSWLAQPGRVEHGHELRAALAIAPGAGFILGAITGRQVERPHRGWRGRAERLFHGPLQSRIANTTIV